MNLAPQIPTTIIRACRNNITSKITSKINVDSSFRVSTLLQELCREQTIIIQQHPENENVEEYDLQRQFCNDKIICNDNIFFYILVLA